MFNGTRNKELEKLEALNRQIDTLWGKACEFDEIPDWELFIVFSDYNPFVEPYNQAVHEKVQLMKDVSDNWVLG